MITKSKGLFTILLVLAACLVLGTGSARADVVFLQDGAYQHPTSGGWAYPEQGQCGSGSTWPPTPYAGYSGIDTRPECLGIRLNATSGTCTAAGGTWTSGCDDLVNNTQALCVAAGDRLWNTAANRCAILMSDDDRNNVTCALKGGTYQSGCTGRWVMPPRTNYTPALLTGNSAGDQCLRCHNDFTKYNSPRVRDVEDTLYMGHKNMSRPVVAGQPWGGPDFSCTNPSFTTENTCEANGFIWAPTIYPSDDSGNMFDWVNGKITITSSGRTYDTLWIYGDWLAALPRAIYKGDRPGSCDNPTYTVEQDCTANGGTWTATGSSATYSCGRCHTTGWTSDAAIAAPSADARLTKEPERTFPGITYDPNVTPKTGYIDLKAGSPYTEKYASWNSWGIVCSRCHSSAIDSTTGDLSTPPQYSAPTGMSSHHNNMTVADFPAGCSVPSSSCSGGRCTSSNCGTAGGVWYYGYCTDTRFVAGGQAAADAKLQCESTPPYEKGSPNGTWITPCSDSNFATQTDCEGASQTWNLPATGCSIAGVCNNPIYTDQSTCEANSGQWAAATDIVRCLDAGGEYTGNYANRGPVITALCMQCHRQETGGLPYDGGVTPSNPKVGPAHGNVAFVSHAHGNMFLNSAHGEFSGSFAGINSTANYASAFMEHGEAANTGNGCTGCHDVHTSTVAGEEPFHEECMECHSNPSEPSIPQVNIAAINHLGGTGTPLEHVASKPNESCEICHMPGGVHLWRINTDAGYSTFPMPAALTTTVNANTAPDGAYANAAWVDIDAACGQCHGGGSNYATTKGTAASGSKAITVLSTTGFLPGERVRIYGAGALYYDDMGVGKREDLDTYIISIGAGVLNLVGGPSVAIAGATVTQNPTSPGAAYRTKSTLAGVAVGMHNAAGVNYPVTFSIAKNLLTVNVDAVVDCGGGCPAFTYDWNWGDGTTHGTADPDTHTYAGAGTYTITLTVYLDGGIVDTVSRTVNLSAVDLPPVADATCTWDENSWTMTVEDNSSDAEDGASLSVSVDWGDGTLKSFGTQGNTFIHQYISPGIYTVTDKAIDKKLQLNIFTCPTQATPAYFKIKGTVTSSTLVPLPSATVILMKGGVAIKSVTTTATGEFTFANKKPGAYTLKVKKTGYTFNFPAASPTIGPDATGLVISATAP